MIDFSQLQGKTIAITGASRGIGKATARLLAQLGANLVLGARDQAQLHSLYTELKGAVLTLPLDVIDEGSVQQFADRAIESYGHVDVLINCAGFGVFGQMLDLTADQFDQMIAVNLRGTFLCSRSFARLMAERGQGHIINVSSIAGSIALPGNAGYAASKFGVVGLSRVMQAELRASGIQVTAVLPGAVNSSFWDGFENMPDRSQMIPVTSLAKHLVYVICQPEGSFIDEMVIMPPLGIL